MADDDQPTEDTQQPIEDISTLDNSPSLTPAEVEYLIETTDENRISDIQEYFKRKGAIELIATARRHRFSELEDLLEITKPTLTRRLDEGLNLGLLADQRISRDGKRISVYTTHDNAMGLVEYMQDIGLIHILERYRELRQGLEDRRSYFNQSISDDTQLTNLMYKNSEETIAEAKDMYQEHEQAADSDEDDGE